MSTGNWRDKWKGKKLIPEPPDHEKHLSSLSQRQLLNIPRNMREFIGEPCRKRADDPNRKMTDKQREWYRRVASYCVRNESAFALMDFRLNQASDIINELLHKLRRYEDEEVQHIKDFLSSK